MSQAAEIIELEQITVDKSGTLKLALIEALQKLRQERRGTLDRVDEAAVGVKTAKEDLKRAQQAEQVERDKAHDLAKVLHGFDSKVRWIDVYEGTVDPTEDDIPF